MFYVNTTTTTVRKVIPKGSAALSTTATLYSVNIKGSSVKTYNPTTVTVVQPTTTTDGSITIAGVPMQDGINAISLFIADNADSDTSIVTYTQLGSTSAYKVTLATQVDM